MGARLLAMRTRNAQECDRGKPLADAGRDRSRLPGCPKIALTAKSEHSEQKKAPLVILGQWGLFLRPGAITPAACRQLRSELLSRPPRKGGVVCARGSSVEQRDYKRRSRGIRVQSARWVEDGDRTFPSRRDGVVALASLIALREWRLCRAGRIGLQARSGMIFDRSFPLGKGNAVAISVIRNVNSFCHRTSHGTILTD